VHSALEVGVRLPEGHHQPRGPAGHVLHGDPPVADEGDAPDVRPHRAGIGMAMVPRGLDGLGGLGAEAASHGRGHVRDRLSLRGCHLDLDEAELLSRPEERGVRHDVLADGRREVAHLKAAGVPRAGLRPERVARHGLARNRAERRRAAAVQRLSRVRVLVAVGEGETCPALRERHQPHAEELGIGRALHPALHSVVHAPLPPRAATLRPVPSFAARWSLVHGRRRLIAAPASRGRACAPCSR
jgi:hypothetical protein